MVEELILWHNEWDRALVAGIRAVNSWKGENPHESFVCGFALFSLAFFPFQLQRFFSFFSYNFAACIITSSRFDFSFTISG